MTTGWMGVRMGEWMNALSGQFVWRLCRLVGIVPCIWIRRYMYMYATRQAWSLTLVVVKEWCLLDEVVSLWNRSA